MSWSVCRSSIGAKFLDSIMTICKAITPAVEIAWKKATKPHTKPL